MAKIATSRSARSAKNTSLSSTRRAKKLSTSLLRGERAEARGADIRRATLEEIRRIGLEGKLFPSAENPEEVELDESFWKNAKLVMPGELGKVSVHLRLDPDVLAWFKSKGKGHLTRMNAVLRAYYEANRGRKSPARKKTS